jgi:hypothetical protein
LIASTAKLEQNEVIYIATSTAYENQNRYKVGGVGRLTALPTRIQGYQTGRAEGDEIFCAKYWMVHSYSDIEKRIKTMLARFKDNRARDTEMYHLHGRALYDTLEFIITNSYQEDEWFNGRIEQFVCATGQDEPYKSERINLKSAIKLLVNEKEYDVVDITGWSEDKVQEEVERILTLIAESKGKPSLRDETIEWRDISSVIQSLYKRPRMTDWRVAFQRQVPRRSDRLKIKGLRL